MPLTTIHPRALPAATAAACASAQGRFWQAHDFLFANGRSLDDSALGAIPGQLGIDSNAFSACMGQANAGVARDQDVAKQLSLQATPSFLIGRRTKNNEVEVKTVMSGAHPIGDFDQAIASLTAG